MMNKKIKTKHGGGIIRRESRRDHFLCNYCKKNKLYEKMFQEGLCMKCYQKDPKRAKNLEIKKEIENIDLFEEEQNIFEDLMDVLKELGVNITFKNIKIINKFIIRTLKRLK